MKIKDMFKFGTAKINETTQSTKRIAEDIGEIDISKDDVSRTGKSIARKVGKTAAVTSAYGVSVAAAAVVFSPGLVPALVGILGAGAAYKALNRKKSAPKDE